MRLPLKVVWRAPWAISIIAFFASNCGHNAVAADAPKYVQIARDGFCTNGNDQNPSYLEANVASLTLSDCKNECNDRAECVAITFERGQTGELGTCSLDGMSFTAASTSNEWTYMRSPYYATATDAIDRVALRPNTQCFVKCSNFTYLGEGRCGSGGKRLPSLVSPGNADRKFKTLPDTNAFKTCSDSCNAIEECVGFNYEASTYASATFVAANTCVLYGKHILPEPITFGNLELPNPTDVGFTFGNNSVKWYGTPIVRAGVTWLSDSMERGVNTLNNPNYYFNYVDAADRADANEVDTVDGTVTSLWTGLFTRTGVLACYQKYTPSQPLAAAAAQQPLLPNSGPKQVSVAKQVLLTTASPAGSGWSSTDTALAVSGAALAIGLAFGVYNHAKLGALIKRIVAPQSRIRGLGYAGLESTADLL